MMKKIAMLSTGYGVIPELSRIAKELAPDVQVIHYLDDGIVSSIAENQNVIPTSCLKRLLHVAQAAELSGAEALLVTCSSISEFADYARCFLSIPVYKIDEPMLRSALERGDKIGVVATTATTLKPTIRQLRQLAAERRQTPQVEYRLEEAAFRAHLEGKIDLHDTLVWNSILELCQCCDVVVLAQVSIASVVHRLPAEYQEKVLSSPYLGIQRVLVGETGLA